ncbi:hypothetical protein L0U85_12170 [Glycomyces sp. L485]|uniref:hypothetical protein n=1 Tax=Glycomyces sp. L485 TaxID=2909235 RepID=UPI001F4AC1C7|nr:hypothetical protein [Glycomyces sp. L485]MCH7231600.1 hypothetical protein [Glycomyces sp. L485]
MPVHKVADAPSRPYLDSEYSEDNMDLAWSEFSKAFVHACIAQALRKANDTIASNFHIPGVSDFLFNLVGSEYNGVGYPYVDFEDGKTIAGVNTTDGSAAASGVHRAFQEFSEQEEGDVAATHEAVLRFVRALDMEAPESSNRRVIDDVKSDLDEENWESDRARLFREMVTNEIEGVIARIHNTAGFLAAHMQIYEDTLHTARSDVYRLLVEAIGACHDLADNAKPDAGITYSTVAGFAAPAIAAEMTKATVVSLIGTAADLVNKESEEVNLDSNDVHGILGQIDSGIAGIIEAADDAFASSRSEIDEYFSDFTGLPLYKLTLPEPGSVFG